MLELAAEELLGASVGFAPLPGGETYTADRTGRRITRAFLGHIALTGDPAYTGAKVLAVRQADEVGPVDRPSTPNLDRILSERRMASYGVLESALAQE